jgi:CxxC motif-containing protein
MTDCDSSSVVEAASVPRGTNTAIKTEITGSQITSTLAYISLPHLLVVEAKLKWAWLKKLFCKAVVIFFKLHLEAPFVGAGFPLAHKLYGTGVKSSSPFYCHVAN